MLRDQGFDTVPYTVPLPYQGVDDLLLAQLVHSLHGRWRIGHAVTAQLLRGKITVRYLRILVLTRGKRKKRIAVDYLRIDQ